MNIRALSRVQAMSWHFLFSVVIALIIFFLFKLLWYPGGLWELSAAGKLLLLIVGVDVTLGPLLTAIVFNPKKKSLIFDLSIIVLIQVSAFAYGVWIMAQSRPVFLVGSVDRLILVSANDIEAKDLADAPAAYKQLSWTGPRLVGAKSNAKGDESFNLLMQSLSGGPDVDRLPRFYVPYEEVAGDIAKRGVPLAQLTLKNKQAADEIRKEIADLGVNEADTAIILLRARKGFGVALIDKDSGKLLATFAQDLIE